MKFETERLILRPARMSDWKDIVEGANDLEVSKTLLVVPYPYRKKDAVSFIEDCIKKSKERKPKGYVFFIELKGEGKVIGVTSLDVDKSQGIGKTGSWINKKYWRNGYILEAKVPVLDFAFKKLRLRRISTSAFAENIASQKMSETLGFKREGLKR